MGTIGVLALIVAYLGVTLAAVSHAVKAKSLVWLALGLLGTLAMLWPLYNSIYPVPPFPGNLWPYVVGVWIALGAALAALRPGIGDAEP